MSILLHKQTKILVQGITGRDGAFHTKQMIDYGTAVQGGVTPGKGGQKIHGLPVFNSVNEAVEATGAEASVIFVPPRFASAAIKEAAESPVNLIICITEGIPVNDIVPLYHLVRSKGKVLIGPNCPGLISPGQSKVGIMPGKIHTPGNVGVISRSGTLTYEVVYNLTKAGIGQSTCIGIGGDPVIGSDFVDLLKRFNEDPGTESVVLIGEIGGDAEELAAEYIKTSFTKKVAAFISGRTAPAGKQMGHAGAIVSGGKGNAEDKIKALEKAGVKVAETPDVIPELLKNS